MHRGLDFLKGSMRAARNRRNGRTRQRVGNGSRWKGLTVVKAAAPDMDIVSSRSGSDAETTNSNRDTDSRTRKIESERAQRHASANIKPHVPYGGGVTGVVISLPLLGRPNIQR
jgi:hypothetical protein